MALTSRTIWIVATLLAGAAMGCGATGAASAPATTAASVSAIDEPTVALMEHHRHHHHGGVTLFIAMSLDTLGVDPEQQAAVEKLRGDLHAGMEPARVSEQSLVSTLADGVAAGNIDTTKVDAMIAQLIAAAGAVHDASAGTLNQLHAVLNPPQRAALVDKVEAHWAVWEKANADGTGPATEDGDRLAALATELGLTPDQVEKIRTGVAAQMSRVPRLDPQEIAAALQAFGDAFRSESFDAKALTTESSANAHLVGWGSAHLAHFIEASLPVLTADQRAELAQKLREHAAHNPSTEGNR